MTYLKFYQENNKLFAEATYFFTDTHTLFITKKIAHHFKIKVSKIAFRKMRAWGRAHYTDNSITFHHGTSMLVIAEELAHLWQWQRIGKSFHGKALRSLMKRILAFARKMNWWIGLSPNDKSTSTFVPDSTKKENP